MISSPVPTVNRIPGTKGFQNRMRFTSLRRVRTMSSGHDLLPDTNRSRTARSMPWYFYRNLTDANLKTTFAYLQALPPVKHRVDKYGATHPMCQMRQLARF